MSRKRFTDTEKWNRPWFRSLPVPYRFFWIYILDNCNMAGIWYVDLDMASFMVGEKIELGKATRLLSKQIERITGGTRWLVKDFISFQYGKYSPHSNVHYSVLKTAAAVNLKLSWDGLPPSLPPSLYHTLDPRLDPSPKDKDKDKDKAKEKDKEKALDRDKVLTTTV